MTEFLKGYASGANDMEAGRLVTKPTVGVQTNSTAEQATIAHLRARALTAEEATLLLGELREGHRISTVDWSRIEVKLSLIANGGQDV